MSPDTSRTGGSNPTSAVWPGVSRFSPDEWAALPGHAVIFAAGKSFKQC